MTQFLPPNLLALFAPRDPPPFLPPPDKLTHEKKRMPYQGIAQYAHLFEVSYYHICISIFNLFSYWSKVFPLKNALLIAYWFDIWVVDGRSQLCVVIFLKIQALAHNFSSRLIVAVWNLHKSKVAYLAGAETFLFL